MKIQTSNGLAVRTLHEYEQQTQDISLLRTFQLSNTVHHPYQSVQCVCLCVCIFCIVTLEPLSTCVRFFSFLICILTADDISILLYIMCVMLRLFSALSRRVGALQISIIIIIIKYQPLCLFYHRITLAPLTSVASHPDPENPLLLTVSKLTGPWTQKLTLLLLLHEAAHHKVEVTRNDAGQTTQLSENTHDQEHLHRSRHVARSKSCQTYIYEEEKQPRISIQITRNNMRQTM